MARVLIVDDSPGMRRNLQNILNRAGHEVVDQAMDGGQAYNLYKMHQPDIVTMDITMPEVNGLEAVKRIIGDFPEAKIIMVSALDQKDLVLEALKYGAKHHVIKPINPDLLRFAINKLMGMTPPANPEPVEKPKKINLDSGSINPAEDNVKIEQLSNLDDLTQIPNRRFFDFILSGAWAKALKEKNPVSLLMIDIDFFKKFNEIQGKTAGDECLKNIAGLIVKSLKRSTDIAARYGGEEFSVILPGTDGIGAYYVAEYLRNCVAKAKLEHPASALSQYVTVSIGVASTVPNSDTGHQELIRLAGEQLYLAKQQGRNRVV